MRLNYDLANDIYPYLSAEDNVWDTLTDYTVELIEGELIFTQDLFIEWSELDYPLPDMLLTDDEVLRSVIPLLYGLDRREFIERLKMLEETLPDSFPQFPTVLSDLSSDALRGIKEYCVTETDFDVTLLEGQADYSNVLIGRLEGEQVEFSIIEELKAIANFKRAYTLGESHDLLLKVRDSLALS